MKKNLLLAVTLLLASSLLSASAAPKDDVTAAAKQLADNGNYSWKTTVASPQGGQGQGGRNRGPTDGKITKDGIAHIKMTMGENATEAYLKDGKAVATNPDGGWQTLDEMANSEGRGRFMVGTLRNFKAPAVQASELASDTTDLKKDGDAYVSDLTEERAKALLSARGGRGPSPRKRGMRMRVRPPGKGPWMSALNMSAWVSG